MSDHDAVASSAVADDPSLRQRLLQRPEPRDNPYQLSHQRRRSVPESVDSDEMDELLREEIHGKPGFRLSSIFSLRAIVLLLWNTFHRTTFGAIVVFVLSWASVFIYVSFYYLYIPSLDLSHAIHFQFDAVCRESCSLPFADIRLNQHRAPNFFAKGQLYKIRIDLSLPESDINWDQGMFMVRLALHDSQERLVHSAARPAILRYKSPLLRILSVVCNWPLLVTGFKHETQTMSIDLMEDYIDGVRPKVGSAVSAKVELEARFIQVYSSTLVIQAHLTGLRYFMVNWPLLTGLVGIATIFGFLAMITICGVVRTLPGDREDDEIDYADFSDHVTETETAVDPEEVEQSDDNQTSPDSTVD